jgi:hypothetical protein
VFTAAGVHDPLTTPAQGFAVVDFDRDGDLDAVLPGTTFVNDGSGTFAARANSYGTFFEHLVDLDGTLTPVTGETGRIAIGSDYHQWSWSQEHTTLPVDVDRDGDLDVVVASIIAPYRPYHFGAIQGVLFNLQRQLFAPRLARLGLPWLLEIQARSPGAIAAVMLGGAELAPRLDLPPLGALGVDPATAVVLPLVTAGTAPSPNTIVLAIPPDTRLLGLPLFAQALVVPATGNLADARLTGVVRDRIER